MSQPSTNKCRHAIDPTGKRRPDPAINTEEQKQPDWITLSIEADDLKRAGSFGTQSEVVQCIYECTTLPLDIAKMIVPYSEDFQSWITDLHISINIVNDSDSGSNEKRPRKIRYFGWLPRNNALFCRINDSLVFAVHLDSLEWTQVSFLPKPNESANEEFIWSVCELPSGHVAVSCGKGQVYIFSLHSTHQVAIVQLLSPTPENAARRIRCLSAMGTPQNQSLIAGWWEYDTATASYNLPTHLFPSGAPSPSQIVITPALAPSRLAIFIEEIGDVFEPDASSPTNALIPTYWRQFSTVQFEEVTLFFSKENIISLNTRAKVAELPDKFRFSGIVHVGTDYCIITAYESQPIVEVNINLPRAHAPVLSPKLPSSATLFRVEVPSLRVEAIGTLEPSLLRSYQFRIGGALWAVASYHNQDSGLRLTRRIPGI